MSNLGSPKAGSATGPQRRQVPLDLGNANGVKKCPKCEQIKPRADFHNNKTTFDGLQTNCITCMKAMPSAQLVVPLRPTECAWCGKSFNGDKRRKYCSAECAKERKSAVDRARQYNPNRRRRKNLLVTNTHKECSRCGVVKPLHEFFTRGEDRGHQPNCKPCHLEIKRINGYYGRKRPRKTAEQRRQEKQVASQRGQRALAKRNAGQAWEYWLQRKAPDSWLNQYWQSHPMPWRDSRLTEAEVYRMRYRLDQEFAIKERLRRQITKRAKKDGIGELIRGAIRRNTKSNRVEELLGYSIADLKCHLEKQFWPGMSWEAFCKGQIHIDHIVPQSQFNMELDEDWRACWALSNLQPLWAKNNQQKRDKPRFYFEYLECRA